jgi:cytochrome c biogenesis protein CcdA
MIVSPLHIVNVVITMMIIIMGINMIEVAELLELKLLNKFKKRVLELREELK